MKIYIKFIFLVVLVVHIGCDEFVEVDPPRTELVKKAVFEEAPTAEAAVVDLYISLYSGFGGGDQSSITSLTSLSSDELKLYGEESTYLEFGINEVSATNSSIESMWNSAYSVVYKANAVIEGLSDSAIDPSLKEQLTGEALFIRAYTYFYLVNLWGDVPLITSTDYEINSSVTRTKIAEVYQRIVADLLNAKLSLPEDYKGKKVRASSDAAAALLARVYLYLGEWEAAEFEATALIDDDRYRLEDNLKAVFGQNSREAIFQIWYSPYPREVITFLVHPAWNGPLFASMDEEYVESFAAGDLRHSNWIHSYSSPVEMYYGANKYDFFDNPADDYSTLLRLAEQYLIRAEARIYLDDMTGARADLNVIRLRAGLLPITADGKQELLDAVYQERKHELFVEQGHRWLDLKRTGRLGEILAPLKPAWDDADALYPIPEGQIIGNPAINQNPLGS